MITHEIIKNIVGEFTDAPLDVERYVDLYHNASLSLFMQRYAEGHLDSLRGFKVVMGEGGVPGLIVTNGTAAHPAGFFEVMSGYYYFGAAPVLINFVDSESFDHMLQSSVEFPTVRYPIACVDSQTIRFEPKIVNHVRLTYLSKPVPPVYYADYSTGIPEFDASKSSKVLWTESDIPVIISMILQSLNIIINPTDINIKSDKQ